MWPRYICASETLFYLAEEDERVGQFLHGIQEWVLRVVDLDDGAETYQEQECTVSASDLMI